MNFWTTPDSLVFGYSNEYWHTSVDRIIQLSGDLPGLTA